jgi:hypothetical protein
MERSSNPLKDHLQKKLEFYENFKKYSTMSYGYTLSKLECAFEHDRHDGTRRAFIDNRFDKSMLKPLQDKLETAVEEIIVDLKNQIASVD